MDTLTFESNNVSMSPKRDRILDAALGVFGRYGYRRTSMDLIATAAGVSRPALYQHFSGKDDIFRAVGERMVDTLVEAAERAAHTDAPVADRLFEALAVKLDLVAGSVEAEYRAEMVTEAAAVIPDLPTILKSRHAAVIETLLADATDELDRLNHAYKPQDVAVLLIDALTGIAQRKDPAPELRRSLRQLTDLTVHGLSSRTTHRETP
jgi:TetR/AcrR family transcriptional regulator